MSELITFPLSFTMFPFEVQKLLLSVLKGPKITQTMKNATNQLPLAVAV